MNILLLNIDDSIHKELVEFLSEISANAIFSNDIADAYEVLEQKSIQLIIIDIGYSLKNDIIKYVNKNYPDTDVILTANKEGMDTIKTFQTAKYMLIEKPYKLLYLKDIIESKKSSALLKKQLNIK